MPPGGDLALRRQVIKAEVLENGGNPPVGQRFFDGVIHGVAQIAVGMAHRYAQRPLAAVEAGRRRGMDGCGGVDAARDGGCEASW